MRSATCLGVRLALLALLGVVVRETTCSEARAARGGVRRARRRDLARQPHPCAAWRPCLCQQPCRAAQPSWLTSALPYRAASAPSTRTDRRSAGKSGEKLHERRTRRNESSIAVPRRRCASHQRPPTCFRLRNELPQRQERLLLVWYRSLALSCRSPSLLLRSCPRRRVPLFAAEAVTALRMLPTGPPKSRLRRAAVTRRRLRSPLVWPLPRRTSRLSSSWASP